MVFRGMKPGPAQVAETKKAFFAGAWAIVAAAEEIGQPHITEDEGVAYLEARLEECRQFKERIMDEYAKRN